MNREQKITSNIRVPNTDLEVLKKYFSYCFDKNGNFLIEKFKQNLSEKEINFSNESYSLDWLGKSYARLLANDPATTLLKEDEAHNQKEENINSENLLIKGDNLEVLKHLVYAYYEKIKMIYIDPPYNTGNDGFIYQDDRKFTIQELCELADLSEDKAKRILDFTQSKSNSHSAWLTFIYPRLYIAKLLLKDDGVIFVSIDDNEIAQLRLLMDEIFGEENFIAELPTIMNLKGNNDEFGFAGTHEFTVVYAKNKDKTQLNQFTINEDDLEEWLEDESGFYKQGANLKATGANAPKEKRPNLYFPIFVDSNDTIYVTDDDMPPPNFIGNLTTIYPITSGQEMSWRWQKAKVKRDYKDIIISRNGSITLYKKQRPGLGDLPSKKPKTIFYKPEYSSGNGTTQIKDLLGDKYFPNPKPIELIRDFATIGANTNEIILDFFSGSGTLGDAIIQLNAEDGGTRKYILVQLPEPINPEKDKAAYEFVKNELKIDEPTIFEITKERIIRATKKVRENIKSQIAEKEKDIKSLESKLDFDNKENRIKQLKNEIQALDKQDLGFKIFETIPIWENYEFEADKLDSQLQLFDFEKLNINDLRALLVTWKTYDGIPLTQDLQTIDLGGYISYYGNNKLYLINKGFKTDNLKTLLEKIDADETFNPSSIVTFGYHFESKHLREISENIKSYMNKKNIDIDLITRY